MNKGLFRILLPHLIAVIVFLVVALIYCRPALQGQVLQQHDIAQWKGAFHESEVYKETHGRYPLWTNSLFSGMPTFQIGGVAENSIAGVVNTILTLGLPKPISFFFLASICFYILTIILGIRSYIGILGSLAFAYATYNPVIISVGHDTKMLSIAYMPAVVGSFILLYERKFWLGAALAALFTSTMIAMNHLQIVYYAFIVIGIMSVFYLVKWIQSKDFGTIGKSVGLAVIAVGVGVLTNAVSLFSTYEYQKETIRGGGSELAAKTSKDDAKNGLDKDYALSYSMNITEPFVLMVPRMYGGSSDHLEVAEEDSKAIASLQSMPQELAQQLQGNISFYWGGMTKLGEVGTSGPPYVGAIICFLAILSLFVLDSRYKWWAATAIVVAIIMSWGHYFEGFNGLLYQYLPFYNKFRAPSMIMVIPQLLLPMLAVLCLDKLVSINDRAVLLAQLKKGLIATGGVFVLLFLLYFSFDFLSGNNKEILKQVSGMNQPQVADAVRSFFNALADDRKSLMMKDILRSLGFIALAIGIIFLMLRNTIKPLAAVIAITALAFIDVIGIDTTYLSTKNYQDEVENSNAFQKTKADEELLADKSFYRVLNVSSFTDNATSYYYKQVGGYHPAKLRIYQDLIEHQLMKQPMNEGVLDMLNTKYLIQKDQSGLTGAYQPRPTALGNAWFVKQVVFVPNADAEMNALNTIHPKDTAIVQEQFKNQIPFAPQFDSSAKIELVKNDNEIVTYHSQSATNGFAVFSEVFYDKGWKAFVDGKETPIVKVNYVLRGLALPAGNHNIEFKFEPQGYYTGKTAATVAAIVLLLLIVAAGYFTWRSRKQ
jgi:hypothetical protein